MNLPKRKIDIWLVEGDKEEFDINMENALSEIQDIDSKDNPRIIDIKFSSQLYREKDDVRYSALIIFEFDIPQEVHGKL